MPESDVGLISHLMRRAGFGATRAELEQLASKGYEAVVEDLLNPDAFADVDDDVWKRYNMELSYNDSLQVHMGRWLYRMINSVRPLEEKMTLFWHHVFATAWYKSEHTPSIVQQIETFRQVGMTDMNTILVALAKDPAMNYWLDNCENHKDEPNENWGRELLELFSMGVGHYTEIDIKNASRAFTGWTFEQPIPLYPFGSHESAFRFVSEDHDDSEKTFLGETGNFNGEDIVGIVVKQKATAQFISRHLYNFFVADELQVPSWELEQPRDPAAIEMLVNAYFENNGEIKPILRTLFNSDFFKAAQFKKIKSPAELVAGTIKVVGTFRFPEPNEGIVALAGTTTVMGQQLMNPPTVEGWHTGHEWIDGGTLNERINFAVNQFNDLSKPGIQDIVDRLGQRASKLSPGEFVDGCLDLIGPVEVSQVSRDALLRYANAAGDIRFDSDQAKEESAAHVGRMLQLIVSTKEYQFA
ncbi:MAG: DUF1800 domain-containing protein [Chloroflexi bacterium]|nr:DUF1800 domain-containing protein [Chloroflexota bacterium]